MSHPQQQTFLLSVKKKFPLLFKGVDVLDIGSMDINGNNRYLFEDSSYTGVDIGEGKNVDVVCEGHLYSPGKQFDVVISSECFEHDKHWRETITNCISLVKQGRIFLFTCATTGRQEHGTTRTTPKDSPFTNDYYRNLTKEDILSIDGFKDSFSSFAFSGNNSTKDLYFYGIKK